METVVSLSIPAILAVAGYLLRRKYIDPVNDYRKLRREIASSLIYYANLISNPGSAQKEVLMEASNALRLHASNLSSCLQVLPTAGILRFLFRIPSHNDLKEASRELIGLSNGVFGTRDDLVLRLIEFNERRVENVRILLRIKPSR